MQQAIFALSPGIEDSALNAVSDIIPLEALAVNCLLGHARTQPSASRQSNGAIAWVSQVDLSGKIA